MFDVYCPSCGVFLSECGTCQDESLAKCPAKRRQLAMWLALAAAVGAIAVIALNAPALIWTGP